MNGAYDGPAVSSERREAIHDTERVVAVQAGGRFIQKDEAWREPEGQVGGNVTVLGVGERLAVRTGIGDELAADGNALPFTAGDTTNELAAHFRVTHLLQAQLFDHSLNLGSTGVRSSSIDTTLTGEQCSYPLPTLGHGEM